MCVSECSCVFRSVADVFERKALPSRCELKTNQTSFISRISLQPPKRKPRKAKRGPPQESGEYKGVSIAGEGWWARAVWEVWVGDKCGSVGVNNRQGEAYATGSWRCCEGRLFLVNCEPKFVPLILIRATTRCIAVLRLGCE